MNPKTQPLKTVEEIVREFSAHPCVAGLGGKCPHCKTSEWLRTELTARDASLNAAAEGMKVEIEEPKNPWMDVLLRANSKDAAWNAALRAVQNLINQGKGE